MTLYHDILLFLHLIGLGLGMGIGVANIFIGRMAMASPPESAATLRGLAPRLGMVSTVGLGILVVTGLLLFIERGFFSGLDFWFYLKALSAAGMVTVAYFIYRTQGEIRAGNMSAAARMPMFGPMMGVLSLVTVLFSVFAFH